jgi:hypothetical protein
MKNPDLRNLDFSEKQAKPVEQTDMLNTIARENSDMSKSNPDMNLSEYTTKDPAFGPLGAKGRN